MLEHVILLLHCAISLRYDAKAAWDSFPLEDYQQIDQHQHNTRRKHYSDTKNINTNTRHTLANDHIIIHSRDLRKILQNMCKNHFVSKLTPPDNSLTNQNKYAVLQTEF